MGATLGAGIGPLQGLHGLMLDALVSVKLVTANGSLINVSESENKDLFWGIRGAGFNFGIVTEATYKVSDSTYNGEVLEGDLLFPASANRSVFEIIASYDETLPAELSLAAVLSFNASTDKVIKCINTWSMPLADNTICQSSIILNFVYYGPQDEAMPYIQPFLELEPTTINMTMVPWNELYAALFFGADASACEDRQYLNSAGQGLRQTDVATWEVFFGAMTDFLRQYKEITGAFVASRFPNQAVLAVPDEETAYPYRDIKTHLYVRLFSHCSHY